MGGINIISALKKRWPLLVLLLVAISANFLANDKAVFQIDSEGWHIPVLSSKKVIPKNQEKDNSVVLSIPAIVPYSPNTIQLNEAGKAPLHIEGNAGIIQTHWLGTDVLGRDLLSNLIHGFRTSVLIAALAIFIALLIGLSIGSAAGYFQNTPIQLSILKILLFATISWIFFNAIYVQLALGNSLFGILVLLLTVLLWLLIAKIKLPKSRHKLFTITIYTDKLFLFTINLFSALPAYFVLLAMLALVPSPNVVSIAIMLGLMMWTDIARLTRTEIIRLKNTNLHQAAVSIGLSPIQIILKHLLPNALQPALATLGFGIGGAILAEAFLSFIGVAPAEMVSWGSLIAQAREYPNFWWLSVFPGLAIFLIILLFYRQSSNNDYIPSQL